MKTDYIYIFTHIPKTAGYTFRYHLIKNFKESEILVLSYDSVGLDSKNPPTNPKSYKNAVDTYISKLSEESKERIKIIFGHQVYYGIHRYFSKPARYITFIRKPIRRAPSLYKQLSKTFLTEAKGDVNNVFYKKTFLINENVPNFKEWLENKYSTKDAQLFLSMRGYLWLHGFLNMNDTSNARIINSLRKYYFIGITKNYNNDAYYLYNLLGINKFFFDQNVSQSVDIIRNKKGFTKLINKISIIDNLIFEQAKILNRDFIRENSNYNNCVKTAKWKRRMFLPFTQVIFAPRRTLLRLKWFVLNGVPLFSK